MSMPCVGIAMCKSKILAVCPSPDHDREFVIEALWKAYRNADEVLFFQTRMKDGEYVDCVAIDNAEIFKNTRKNTNIE